MDSQAHEPRIRIAIAISNFNGDITERLLKGARARLAEDEVSVEDEDIVEAPGAFELPLIAQTLARTRMYDGIICLGCVIKGETAHFEYISLSASWGLMTASLNTQLPITFGILTTYTDAQAEARSHDNAANKGREAAEACLRAIHVLNRIRDLVPTGGTSGAWDVLGLGLGW
jgi:6,7-dimethyl-8-ribityllumazine synthase